MADPRTKLDVIYQEVLGEVAELVTRLEQTAAKVAEAGQAGELARQAVSQAAAEAGRAFRRDLDKHSSTLLEGLQKAAGEAKAAAMVVDKAGRRFALLALVTGLAAGLVGGCLAGLAIARGVFGG